MTQDNTHNDDIKDDALSSLYQQVDREQPPVHVDDAILSLAQKEAGKDNLHHTHPVSPFSGKWPISASLVAVLVIAFGLVTFIDKEAPQTFDELKQIPADQLDENITPPHTDTMTGKLSKKQIAKSKPNIEASAERLEEQVAPLRRGLSAPTPTAPVEKKSEMALSDSISTRSKAAPSKNKTDTAKLKQAKPTTSIATLAEPEPTISEERKEVASTEAELDSLTDKDRSTSTSSAGGLEQERLSVAAGAQRQARTPAPSSAFMLQQPTDTSATHPCGTDSNPISTEEYWLYYILDEISHSTPKGGVVCLLITHGARTTAFYLPQQDIQDKQAQEKAFRNYLSTAIHQLKSKQLSVQQRNKLYLSLNRVTGLSFSSNAQWIEWYSENAENLTLSPPENILK